METTLDALTVGRVAENLVTVAVAVEMWMRQGAAWWRSLALGVVLGVVICAAGCAPEDLQTIPPEGAASLGYAPESYEAHVASLQALEVNDATVRYLDLGEGPVVLLVHGVPTSSWVYRKVAASLAGRGFRVIAPDLPGWGASEKPEDAGSMTPEAQGRTLVALMDALGVSSWIQVAHDAGGPWSFEMIPDAGARIRGLVLLNTVIFEEGWRPPLRFREGSGMSRLVGRALAGPRNARWARLTVSKGTEDRALARDAGLVEGYRRPLSEGSARSVQVFVHDFEPMCESLPRYHAAIASLDAPIGVVWGMKDQILRGRAQIPMLQALETREPLLVRELEFTNHFVQEERHEEVVRMVEQLAASVGDPDESAEAGGALAPREGDASSPASASPTETSRPADAPLPADAPR